MQVQTCLSTDAICRRICSAKEVGIKLSILVYNTYDICTGEPYVGGVTVQKTVWSQSILTVLSEQDSTLHALFDCHNTFNKVFDIKNTCVFAEDQSKIIGSDGPGNDEETMFKDIVPHFTGNVKNDKTAMHMY